MQQQGRDYDIDIIWFYINKTNKSTNHMTRSTHTYTCGSRGGRAQLEVSYFMVNASRTATRGILPLTQLSLNNPLHKYTAF